MSNFHNNMDEDYDQDYPYLENMATAGGSGSVNENMQMLGDVGHQQLEEEIYRGPLNPQIDASSGGNANYR